MAHKIFNVSDNWRVAFPGALAGILVMTQVTNPPHHATLESEKAKLEDDLRTSFAGQEKGAIAALPPIEAYNAYYKRFKKSYHVQMQLESIIFKGKPIPTVAALVEAMFMAEVKNCLLTAGHDLEMLQLPVTLEVAKGDEQYLLLRGQEQVLKPGDMYMADQAGIISSILYGPDQRTQITAQTQRALFAVYAPPGIDAQAVKQHLRDIEANARLVAPAAQTELCQVFGASS